MSLSQKLHLITSKNIEEHYFIENTMRIIQETSINQINHATPGEAEYFLTHEKSSAVNVGCFT